MVVICCYLVIVKDQEIILAENHLQQEMIPDPSAQSTWCYKNPLLGEKSFLQGDFIIYQKIISWHISTSKLSHFPTEIKFPQQFPANATSFPPKAPPAIPLISSIAGHRQFWHLPV